MIKWIKKLLGLDWDREPEVHLPVVKAAEQAVEQPVVKEKKKKQKKSKWDIEPPTSAGIKKPRQPKKAKK